MSGKNGRSVSLTSVELFSGASGLALGMAQAGFHHLAVIERDARACATLEANRQLLGLPPEYQVVPTDVATVDFTPFAGQADVVAGGVPCQPFSLGGKHRGQTDNRNLFPEFLRAVREVAPSAVIIENVKGLLREGFRPYFRYVLEQLRRPTCLHDPGESWAAHSARLQQTAPAPSELVYRVHHQLMNCADFGIPQERHRVFIVAYRADLDLTWDGVHPTHSRGTLRRRKSHQIRDEEPFWNDAPGHSPLPWVTVREALEGLPEPSEWADHPTIPQHRVNPGARAYPGHTGSPLDWPAKALKAGDHGVPGGENMLRRDDRTVRYFTVREAARIQTFPDDYRFEGPWSEAMRQLGNAVPMRVARLVAESVMAQLRASSVANNGVAVSHAVAQQLVTAS